MQTGHSIPHSYATLKRHLLSDSSSLAPVNFHEKTRSCPSLFDNHVNDSGVRFEWSSCKNQSEIHRFRQESSKNHWILDAGIRCPDSMSGTFRLRREPARFEYCPPADTVIIFIRLRSNDFPSFPVGTCELLTGSCKKITSIGQRNDWR
jgi:hypothetical protein